MCVSSKGGVVFIGFSVFLKKYIAKYLLKLFCLIKVLLRYFFVLVFTNCNNLYQLMYYKKLICVFLSTFLKIAFIKFIITSFKYEYI